MYAVIKTGGKQYRVEKGDEIFIEKLEAEAGDTVEFEDVLAVGEDGKVTVGTPNVAGAKVSGTVLKSGRGKKLNIITYKPKKGSVRRIGHRQPYTKVEITAINAK
ncbi:50S ribosomal protein L21 [Ruminococcaceae bacterium OttesenSCG-928-D13]|nr:50S ribosomal protein L21 [Ruminococcaceae bacterium OttesenSCG-928-D13]